MSNGFIFIQKDSTGNTLMTTDDGVNIEIHAGIDGTLGNLDLRAAGVVTVSGGNDFHVSGGDITMGGSTPKYWFASTQTGPYIGKDSVGGIHLVGITDKDISIEPQGTGRVSIDGWTLDVQTVTTTDDTLTTLATIPLNSDKATLTEVSVIARRTDTTGDYAMFTMTVGVENEGTAALVGSSVKTVVARTDTAFEISASVSGTNLLVEVTGATGKTLNWKAIVKSIEV